MSSKIIFNHFFIFLPPGSYPTQNHKNCHTIEFTNYFLDFFTRVNFNEVFSSSLGYNPQQEVMCVAWTKEEKIAAYELLLLQQKGLLEIEDDLLANLANSSALLKETLPDTVFSGYYLFKDDQLILGPFQGRVSCTRIQMGKGVCGESAQKRQTIIVANVKEHENYISCDSAALSEIVVPLVKNNELIGVLDLDSSKTGSYDEIDQNFLEEYAQLLMQ